MAINSAQRHAYQQRSTDAAGFSAALQAMFVFAKPEEQARLVEACAAAVHHSIVHGSPITGAPGQPVDTGELRDSWKIQKVSPTRYKIFTTVPYARAIEHNWRKISRAQFKAAAAKMDIKRLTKRAKATIRKRFSGINFRGRGGSHSLAKTAQHFDRLVTPIVAQFFPGRNIGASVFLRGIGINVGTRSGAPR